MADIVAPLSISPKSGILTALGRSVMMGRAIPGSAQQVNEYTYIHTKTGLIFTCKNRDNSRFARCERPDGLTLFTANNDRGKWVWVIMPKEREDLVVRSTDVMRGPFKDMDQAVGDMMWYLDEHGSPLVEQRL